MDGVGWLVFIGSWNRHKPPGGTGFAVCRQDPRTGELHQVQSAGDGISIGAVHKHPTQDILYCVDEYTTLPGYFLGGGGRVFAYRVDRASGALTEINNRPSFGSLPSYLTTDRTGQYLIVAHHTDRVPVTKILGDGPGYRIGLEYDDATTVVFPLDASGAIQPPCDVFRHEGGGGPLPRQTHPQLHSVTLSPSGKLLAVCDKGNDEIVLFRLDEAARRLVPCRDAAFKCPPGSSPRYTAFHPALPYLFVNHETQAIVSALRYDDRARLDLVCTVSALPAGVDDHFDMKQSDLGLHPSGRYLYTLVRGISAVTVFEIDQGDGRLEAVQTVILDGQGPRSLAISPGGRFMILTAHASNEVLVWTVGDDGRLAPTGHKLDRPFAGTATYF
jgi:6-phosphogluconolactonase (cycloisomerase 2 family)